MGTGGSDGIVATITLPAGVTLGAVAFDRGAGCTGTTVLTCQLDFLNGGLVAHLRIDVQAQVAGSLVATVVLAADQPDVNPANNTATATTPSRRRGRRSSYRAEARSGRHDRCQARPECTGASVGFGVSLNRAATVKMTVKVQGRDPVDVLRAGSKLGLEDEQGERRLPRPRRAARGRSP